jgi:uncharacterized protein (TIGR02594 family)
MAQNVTHQQLLERIDSEIAELVKIRDGASSEAQRIDAHKAVKGLRDLKIEVLEIREAQLAGALGQVGNLLRMEAAELGANPFKAAFARIGSLVGIALAPEGGAAVTVPEAQGSFEGLNKFVDDLRRGVLGTVKVIVERPAPPTTPAAVDRTPPTDEQRQLAAAIHRAAADRGVSAGLLGAVAFVESGFRNIGSTTSSATGPFQFIRGTWNGMVKRFGPETGIEEADIADVEAQAEMAALAFRGYRQALAEVLDDPPDAAVYLCHFLGPAAAKACLSGSPSRPIDEVLSDFYRNKRVGKDFVVRILSANPQLLTGGRPRTVEEVLELYEARLLDGEARFQQLVQPAGGPASEPATAAAMDGHATPAEGVAKWLAIALAEKDKGVAQSPGGEHNPEILKYIASTTIGSDPKFLKDETAWCSAFVNWCVSQAGLKGTNSAKARNWHDNGGWGRPIDEPVKGCIAVLWRERPDHPDRLGHVGFYDRAEGDKIFLLGGNQGGAINVAPYPRARLLSFRMPS